jgi:hypothetical protein
MPLEAVVEFGVRLVGGAVIDVIHVVGSGDTRAAAATRGVVFFGGAVGLWLFLSVVTGGNTGLFTVAGLIFLIGIGGYLTRRMLVEVRRLVHWGEPEVTAGLTGLLLSRRSKTIAWEEFASVTRERRGTRGRVRIRLVSRRAPDIFIATRKPDALAAAILADNALKDLSK